MEIVDLDIDGGLYARLAKLAREEQVPVQVIAERVLQDAMDPPEPARRYVSIECSRCGVSKHRFTRSKLARPGVFAHLFGCLACFRIRRYGETPIKGLKPAAPAAPAGRFLARPQAMEPGVPEALQ